MSAGNSYDGPVLEGVKACLAAALGVDAEKVTPPASLVRDLGAESIDFLDVIFRLEKRFGIKIPRDDLFPEKILTNPQFVKNGRLSPAGLEELKRKLTAIDLTEFGRDPVIAKLPELFTVKMILDYVASRTRQPVSG